MFRNAGLENIEARKQTLNLNLLQRTELLDSSVALDDLFSGDDVPLPLAFIHAFFTSYLLDLGNFHLFSIFICIEKWQGLVQRISSFFLNLNVELLTISFLGRV
mgnify:CR=1 FL=1